MWNHRASNAGLGAALVVLLLALGGLPSAGAAVSTLIVPGEALGPARLGMSVADLTSVLGPSVPLADGQIRFPQWAITVRFQNGVAVRLSTTDPRFQTRRGAGVGTYLGQASHLIGDLNQVETVTGAAMTVEFPFQGIGFVFRTGRAAQFPFQGIGSVFRKGLASEVFVVERIALGSGTPLAPAQAALQSRAPKGPRTGESGAAVAIQGLAETVDATAGFFHVTGRVVNTGPRPIESVTVTAIFERFSGDDSWKQLVIQRPLEPGAEAPFSIGTYVRSSIVDRYTVEIAAGTPGSASILAQEKRVVPPAVYAELALQMVEVSIAQGPPSNTARALAIQVLVWVSGTGSIPPAWIKDVRVEVFHNIPTGSQEIHLIPGRVQTILVPSSRGTLVTTAVKGVKGFIPVGPVEPLVTTAVVQDVLLSAP